MPKFKRDVIKISIEVNGERFTLNCHEQLFNRYRVKLGRSWSKKHTLTTLTEIFELSRRWAVSKTKGRTN